MTFFQKLNNLEKLISENLTLLGWEVAKWNTTTFFTETFLLQINPHWLSYSPPSDTIFDMLAITYFILMSVGVFGNGLVIYMFLRRRSLRTSANIFVTNLAVSDLFLLLKTPIFIYNCLKRGPALGEFGCTLYGFIGGLTGTVSIITLTAIAFDRYRVIVHPLAQKPKQANYTVIALLWIYGGFVAILPVLKIGFNTYTAEGYLTSCSFDYLSEEPKAKLTIFLFFLAAWVIPFSIISTCYIKICSAVLKSRKHNDGNFRHCKESVRRKRDIKLAIVVAGVVGLWFISWTPYAIVALMGISGIPLSPGSTMFPALFCKTASSIDPFVYAITHPRFRRELRRMVRGTRLSKEFTKAQTLRLPERRKSSVEEVIVMVDSKKNVWYTTGHESLRSSSLQMASKIKNDILPDHSTV